MDIALYIKDKIKPACKSAILTLILFLLVPLAARSQEEPQKEIRLLFTGDILLSRLVRLEIGQRHGFPWRDFKDVFSNSDFVAGNLEGAVGRQEDCPNTGPGQLCFSIPPDLIPLLKQAGFHALTLENNHSGDLGERGRESTRGVLSENGLDGITFEESPAFFTINGVTIGILAINTVHSRGSVVIPSTALTQKLRLARRMSNLVIVSVHWGSELLDWPNDEQRRMAEWLVRNGADVVIGHHPHVIQKPELVLGKPVFFSLGNHLFDQKYPETKEGLIADIRISNSEARFSGIATSTEPGTSFPRLAGGSGVMDKINTIRLALTSTLEAGGFQLRPRQITTPNGQRKLILEAYRGKKIAWRTNPTSVVSIERGKLAGPDGPEFLFVIERHASPIDREDGLRPYVYEVTERGLISRWRGSALAWPLLDARLLPGYEDILCALHRSDSFLVLNPDRKGTRTAAYRWNGFGFSGINDPVVTRQCEKCFE